jgi:hypothetical protein
LGYSRKHPYLPHRGNWELTPLDVLIHLLLSETIFFLSFPLQIAEMSALGEGGGWTFYGITHFVFIYINYCT